MLIVLLVDTKKTMLPHTTRAKVVQQVGIKVPKSKDFVIDVKAADIKHLRANRRAIIVLRVGTRIYKHRLRVSRVLLANIRFLKDKPVAVIVQQAGLPHLIRKLVLLVMLDAINPKPLLLNMQHLIESVADAHKEKDIRVLQRIVTCVRKATTKAATLHRLLSVNLVLLVNMPIKRDNLTANRVFKDL